MVHNAIIVLIIFELNGFVIEDTIITLLHYLKVC